MNVNTTVQAGVCGFETQIKAQSPDDQNVSFEISTNCEKIAKLAEVIPASIDAFSEIGTGFDGDLYKSVKGVLKGCCAGCAVPVGLFKSMQVAAGLALPRDIAIFITKE